MSMATSISVVFSFLVVGISCEILLIDELLQQTSYDKRLRPYASVTAVNVSVHIEILQLGPIREDDMTMEINYYFRQRWNDPRLTLDGPTRSDVISAHPAALIWVPDVKVVNAIEVLEFPGYTRTIISSNGNIYFSQRVKAKVHCPMKLQRYPMDTQRCYVQLESYAFNKANMNVKWHKEVTVPSQEALSLTGYHLAGVSQDKVVVQYGDIDRYDNLFAYLIVDRTFTYYFSKAYVPSFLLVIFNSGSYWIPDTAEPARVTLIVTTFLASMLILQSVTEQTVKVQYTTAMQIFMLVNILFLVTAILQYILILFLRGRKLKRLKVQKSKPNSLNFIKENGAAENGAVKDGSKSNGNTFGMRIRKKKDKEDNSDDKPKEREASSHHGNGVHILDEIFRFLSLGLYFLFCAIYFPYFFLVKEDFE